MTNKRQYKGIAVSDLQWDIIHLWDKYTNPRSLAVVLNTTEGAVIGAVSCMEKKGIVFPDAAVDVQLHTGLFFGNKAEPYYDNEAEVFRSLLPKYEYTKELEREMERRS
jgi:hypothetical protein